MGQAGQALFEASAGAAARSAQAVLALAGCAPGSVLRQDDGHTATWTDTAHAPALPAKPLDAATWKALGAWRDTVGGRGSAGFIDHGVHGLVLRHYRRGGLVARVLHDTYLGRTPHRSRAMREFALLMRLRHAALPVPQPVAARMQRVGFARYRADLLIARIPGAMSLAERLTRGDRPSRAVWMAIGETIRKLHDQGVDHVDLNAHNLLIDNHDRVWIIDFDRCAERPGQHWKAANLSRLRRSLQKLRNGRTGSGFSEDDWLILEQGYEQRPRPAVAASHSADTGRPPESP
jgi:3-deoxy-D-manno-octulosonic-acid transferase